MQTQTHTHIYIKGIVCMGLSFQGVHVECEAALKHALLRQWL